MPVALHDCPHCNGQKVAFSYRPLSSRGNSWNGAAECPSCLLPVAAHFMFPSLLDFNALTGDFLDSEHRNRPFAYYIYPAAEAVSAPEHLPDNVERAYIEAEKARLAGLYTPACATYRRVMELAMKQFSPDVDAWKLEQRIRKLHSLGLITQALFEWADQLRLDGNDAIHGDAEADKVLTDQMQGLTEMLLIYLYTMPQRIASMREA